MTSREFLYWLRGFLELNDFTDEDPDMEIVLSQKQIKMINDHLALAMVEPHIHGEPLKPFVWPTYPYQPWVTCFGSGTVGDNPNSGMIFC